MALANDTQTFQQEIIAFQQRVDNLINIDIPEPASLAGKIRLTYRKKLLSELSLLLSEDSTPANLNTVCAFFKTQWDFIHVYTASPGDDITILMCDLAEVVTKEINKTKATPEELAKDTKGTITNPPVGILEILMPGIKAGATTHGSYLPLIPYFDEIEAKWLGIDVMDSQRAQVILKTHILNRDGTYLLPIKMYGEGVRNSTGKDEFYNYYYDFSTDADRGHLGICDDDEIYSLSMHSLTTKELATAKENYVSVYTNGNNLLTQLNRLINGFKLNGVSGIGQEGDAAAGAYDVISDFNAFYACLSDDQIAQIPVPVKNKIAQIRNLTTSRYNLVLLENEDDFNQCEVKEDHIYLIREGVVAEGNQAQTFKYKLKTNQGEIVTDNLIVEFEHINANGQSEIEPGNLTRDTIGRIKSKLIAHAAEKQYINIGWGQINCIDQMQKELVTVIRAHEQILANITLAANSRDALLREADARLNNARETLLQSLQNKEYTGQDTLNVDHITIQELKVDFKLNDIADIDLLSTQELAELLKIPEQQQQIMNLLIADISNLPVFLYTERLGHLKLIMTVLKDKLLEVPHAREVIKTCIQSVPDSERLAVLLNVFSLDLVTSTTSFCEFLNGFDTQHRIVVIDKFKDCLAGFVVNSKEFCDLIITVSLNQEERHLILEILGHTFNKFIPDLNTFIEILMYFDNDKKNILIDVLKSHWPVLVKDLDGFIKLMESYPLQAQKAALFDILKEGLSSWVKDVDDFTKLMENYYLADQKEAIFEVLQGDLSGWVADLDDFMRLMTDYRLHAQKAAMFKALKGELPNWVKDLDGFMRLMTARDPHLQKAAIFEVLQGDLSGWVANLNDFMRLMTTRDLRLQKAAMLEALKGELPNWVKDLDGFIHLMTDYDLQDQKATVLEILKEALPGWVKDLNGFIRLMTDYRLHAEKAAMLEALKGELPNWVKDLDGFIRLMTDYRLKDQKVTMFEALKEALPGWVADLDSFIRLMTNDDLQDQKVAMLEVLKEALPSLVKDLDGFICLMTDCKLYDQKVVMFEALKEALPSWVADLDGFIRLMTDYRLQDQKMTMFEVLKEDLPGLVKNLDDCIRLLLVFENNDLQTDIIFILTQDRLPVLVQEPKEFFRLMLSLKDDNAKKVIYEALKDKVKGIAPEMMEALLFHADLNKLKNNPELLKRWSVIFSDLIKDKKDFMELLNSSAGITDSQLAFCCELLKGKLKDMLDDDLTLSNEDFFRTYTFYLFKPASLAIFADVFRDRVISVFSQLCQNKETTAEMLQTISGTEYLLLEVLIKDLPVRLTKEETANIEKLRVILENIKACSPPDHDVVRYINDSLTILELKQQANFSETQSTIGMEQFSLLFSSVDSEAKSTLLETQGFVHG